MDNVTDIAEPTAHDEVEWQPRLPVLGYGTAADKLLQLIREAHPKHMAEFLLFSFLFEPADDITFDEIEGFLKEIYGATYLIKVLPLDPVDAALRVRFLSLDEDFVVTMTAAQ